MSKGKMTVRAEETGVELSARRGERAPTLTSVPPEVAAKPTNMHLSFDRLAALARDVLQQDPLSGHLFVFRNRGGDKVKILGWDRSGFCLWYKRLEQGIFHFPIAAGTHLEVDAAELLLLLDGIELTHARRRARFALPVGVRAGCERKIL